MLKRPLDSLEIQLDSSDAQKNSENHFIKKEKHEFQDSDFNDITIENSLPYHPLSYLIPSQIITPLALPYNPEIQTDKIVFSQDDVNDKHTDTTFLNSEIWKLEDPDLKYVRFKKPCTKLIIKESNFLEKSSPVDMNSNLLNNISPVKKSDYLKYGVKPEKADLCRVINSSSPLENEITDDVIELIDDDLSDNRVNDVIKKESNTKDIPEPVKPEFLYDSTVTQSELLMCVMKDFVNYVKKTAFNRNLDENNDEEEHCIKDEEDEDEDEEDEGLWITYTQIFPCETKIVAPETLTNIKASLAELVQHNMAKDINAKVYGWLLDTCVYIIKESFPIDWEGTFNSGDIFSLDEYSSLLETIIHSCSVVLMLYSNNLVDKIGKHEKGLSLVTDFISTFGGVCKMLFKTESFLELPDFFIPIIKLYSGMIDVLAKNVGSLLFNESLLTRLEYIAFENIFGSIVFTKERMNLNVALEELRAEFSRFLTHVYHCYEDQRPFLFNEIIENFGTLSPLKSKFKNYRLASGLTVQLVSYMLVKFIQSHSLYDEQFNYSKWDELKVSHVSKENTLEFKEINDQLWKSINSQHEKMIKSVDGFVSNFLKKIITTYTPNLRKLVEYFVSDILLMLELPEYMACSVLLNSLLSHSIHICKTCETSLTSAHALIFELIGVIGSRIVQLKGNLEIIDLTEATPSNIFKDINAYYEEVIFYLKCGEINNDDKFMHKFISMLWLTEMKQLENQLSVSIAKKDGDLLGENLKARKTLLKDVRNKLDENISLACSNNTLSKIELPSRESICENFKHILVSTKLFRRYNEIVMFILVSLNDPKIKSRTLAIKNLTLLIDKEPGMIKDERIRKMLGRRLCETSTSVVDASIDLLWKVLEADCSYISEYQEIISQKLLDSSFLVRKKSVNIIRFMFENSEKTVVKSFLCKALLLQIDDEDDRIVDSVCDCLGAVLFLDIGSHFWKPNSADPTLLQKKSEDIIAVLCGILRLGDDVWENFERFMNERMLYRCETDHKFKTELKSTLSLLVDYMIELVTDNREDINEYVTPEAIMGVISTFVKCDQSLITQDQLVTLQPYIINDHQSSEICFYALTILNLALNNCQNISKNFTSSCKGSLMKRLTKLNSKELDCAIQCIWKLFKIDGDTTNISKACVSSLHLLLRYINQLDNGSENLKIDPAIVRLLYLIGNMGRYCNFEIDRIIFIEAKVGLQQNEAIPLLLLKYLLKFCDSSVPKPLRKIAIKNALNICISYPKLFFAVPISGLIDSAFKKRDSSINNIVIGALLTLLENEELRMLKKNGMGIKRSGSLKLDLDVFHGVSKEYVNDGICSTLVQKYSKAILDSCLDGDSSALNSIEFLRMMIKFGFSNPKICFPTVLALECSSSKQIRNSAVQMHRFLFEKYETLIESTYSEALKKTLLYVTKVYSLENINDCKGFLKGFAKVVEFRNSRQHTEKFIQSIVRTIRNVSMHKLQRMEKSDLDTFLLQILFICVNINEVEFSCQFDILTIINFLEKIILSEEGVFINSKFETVNQLFADDDDDESSVELKKYIVMGKILVAIERLLVCLTTQYSITPDLLLKYQESTNKKIFKIGVEKGEKSPFFEGETKNLLISNSNEILETLRQKLQEFR